MEYFVQQLINGITLGSIYGLIAIGYTMVFGIIGMVNFAHGDVFMVGSLVSTGLWGTLGLTLTTGTGGLIPGLILSLIIAMIACGSLNVLIERVGYRPLRGAPKLAPLITARVEYQDAMQRGLGPTELDPAGPAAEEIRQLCDSLRRRMALDRFHERLGQIAA